MRCGADAVGFANVVVLGMRLGAQTDEHGRFRIERVPAGLRRLRVFALGSEPLADSINVVAGAPTAITFHIHPGRIYWNEALRMGSPFFLSYSDSNLIVKGCHIRGDWMRASSKEGSFQVTSSTKEPATLTFDYELVSASPFLSIEVSDASGTLWKRFPRKRVRSGRITWDGRDDRGQQLPDGTYVIRFITEQDSARVSVYRGRPPHFRMLEF